MGWRRRLIIHAAGDLRGAGRGLSAVVKFTESA
jgi:hypothetical protein